MKISVLHPSRNRAPTAEEIIAEWLGKASGLHPIEYILSIDTSDDQIAEYERVAKRHGARLIVHPNRNLVEACNEAARVATGELLIVVSDDVGCPPGWDEALALVVGDRTDSAVLVDDGLGAKTMALPIVGRVFYQSRSYLLFPRFIHHFSQDDLVEVARRLGKLLDARHLLFPHRHYTAGKSAYDETYRNADRSWKQGAHLLRKREVRDFGLRPPTLGNVATCLWLDLDYHWSGVRRLLPRVARRMRGISCIFDAVLVELRKSVRRGREFPHVLGRYFRRVLFGLSRRIRPGALRPAAQESAGQGSAPSSLALIVPFQDSLGYHCYVPVGQVQGDVLLLEHVEAPSHIVCLRDCVVDRSRVRVRPGGGDMPTQRVPEEWDYGACEKGALQLRNLRGLNPSHLRGYLRRFMSSAELVSSLRSEGDEPVTTFAIERWEYSNLSHVLLALFNTYVAIQLLGRGEPFNVLFLDGHCRASLDTFWPDILKPARIRRLHEYPGETTRFRNLILVPSEHESPLWYTGGIAPSRLGDFLSDFVATVLAAYQIVDRPSRERVLTFIDRRDYRANAQSDGTVCRKVDDLDFTIGLLRRLYPQHRIEVHSFENMPFGEQLQIVRETDVLCGVHGAALTHVMFLRPGCELVEFSPPEFVHRDFYPNLTRSRGLRYTRYLARTQRVLANGRHVVRVTDTPV